MAKEMQLSKDGVNVYPLTKDGQVFMSNGKTLKQTMEIDHRTVLHVDYQDSFDLSLLEVSRRHGLILVGGGYGDDIEARILPSFNEGSNWLFEYGDGWKITGDISGWEAGLDSWEGFVNYINLHSSPLTNKSTVDAVSGRISSILKTINNEEYVNPAKVDINICTDMFDFDKLDDTISRIADQLENDAREINSLKHKDNELSLKVNELDTTVNGSHTEEEITTTLTNNGYIARSNGVVTSATSTWRHSDIIPIDKFVSGGKYVSHASVAQVAFYKANEISQANYLGYMAIDGNKTITKDEVVAYANANYPTATHIVLSSNSTTSYGAFVLVYKQGADVDGIVDKIVIDATLTIENRPADAKAVGNEISALKEDIKVYTKFAHLSLDDCTFWTDLIDNENTYTSCFQNPKLAALKAYHDTYGCTFTLNCFIVSGDYSIANVPSKFASEFKAAKGWLRFAFHGTTTTEYFDTDNVEVIKGYYNTFVDAIYQMTGDYDCIDRFTRLSSFTGSVNNVVALSNCACGVRGLLTSDFAMGASGVNYYLDNAQKTYISTHCKLFDATNQIYFLRSLPRIENIKDPNDLATKTYQNISPFVELFWHETANWLTNYFKNNFTIPWLQYLKDNGYKFCFPMDMLY